MPKKHPEPFWRASRNCYFVQIGTRQHRLHPDETEAYRLYHELMSKPPERRVAASSHGPMTVVEALDHFLEWASKNKAPRTYEAYRYLLQVLIDALPDGMAVSSLKPYHVTRAMDAKGDAWSNNTRNDFGTAVLRAFNWAVRQELIDKNPVANLEKPGREARELAVKPVDYAEAMKAIDEPNFRELVRFAWESGARPQEIRVIEARHIDFDQMRITFPPKEAKGKKSIRVIYLTEEGAAILRPLAERHPEGTVFRNSQGGAWTKDSINCAFCRLEKKLGRKLHLGAFRKGYVTEALKNGVDTITVARLAGHVNGVMISKVCAKVSQDPEFMAEAARRARGGGA